MAAGDESEVAWEKADNGLTGIVAAFSKQPRANRNPKRPSQDAAVKDERNQLREDLQSVTKKLKKNKTDKQEPSGQQVHLRPRQICHSRTVGPLLALQATAAAYSTTNAR